MNAVFAQTLLIDALNTKISVLMNLGVNPAALNFTVKYMFFHRRVKIYYPRLSRTT